MAHGDPPVQRFGPFTLDRHDGRLLHGGQATALKPKALALLLVLVDNAGRLVPKEALLDAVWGTRYITEGVIKTQVAELRAVLGDDPRSPRWIETVHGRGYRFAGSVSTDAPDAPPASGPVPGAHPSPVPAPTEALLVGRDAELQRLARAFDRTRVRERQFVGLAGDPGVGKSTLLAAFVTTLDGARVASGQCVERWGGNEPYLPVLDALDLLCAAEPAIVPAVRDVAPMWLLQMPWHLADPERAALQAQTTGASPERMLREFGALTERLSADRPLLLLLEDVHWADPATVHLIAALARRRAAAAVMVVLTFRPIDLAVTDHPFGDLRRDLRAQRLMEEVLLDGLDRAAVRELVRRRHGDAVASDAFVARLHAYTEGLPLFALGVLDDLLEGAGEDAALALAADPASRLAVPQTLADLFDRQLQRLPAEVNALLEVAALAGQPFDHLTLADALGQPADAVRAALDDLVRRRIWLQAAGVVALPDGRIATRCAFRHAVIRHVLAARGGPLDRLERHRALAAAIERHGGATPERAAELALHHEEGRQPADAARHLAVAARTALQRQAPREALAFAERGLAGIADLGPAADAERLPLLSARMTATVLLEGMASEAARAQVRSLLDRLATLPANAGTLPLWQVALLTHVTGRLPGTTALVQRFATLAESLPGADGDLVRAVAGNALGIDALHRGRVTESAAHFERTLAVGSAPAAPLHLLRDPRAEAWSYLTLVATSLGRTAQAAACHAQVDALVAGDADLITVGMGRWFQVYGHFFRADATRAHALASACVALLEARKASPFLQPHRIALGWSLAATGAAAEGLALAADGLDRYLRQGSQQGLAGLHAVVGETARLAGHPDDAARHVALGLRSADTSGDGFALSELHRLAGALPGPASAQEAALRQALALAQGQQARLLEARAAVTLCDWLRDAGQPDEAHDVADAAWSHWTADPSAAADDAPVVAALRARQARPRRSAGQ